MTKERQKRVEKAQTSHRKANHCSSFTMRKNIDKTSRLTSAGLVKWFA